MAVYDDQENQTREEKLERDSLDNSIDSQPEETESAIDISNPVEDEANDEKESLGLNEDDDDNEHKIINNTSNKPKRGLAKRSNQYIAGILISLLTAILSFFFVQLPSFVVNHLAEMLKSIGNVQVDGTRRYRRRHMQKIKHMFTPGGRRAERLLSEMEMRGYRPNIVNGKITGFTRLGDNFSTIGLANTDLIEDFLHSKHPLRTARWKTKQMDAMYNKFNIPRKSVVISSLDLDQSVDQFINKRIADGILSDEELTSRGTGQTAANEGDTEEIIAERQRRLDLANDLINDDAELLDGIRAKIKDGTPISRLDPDEIAILRISSVIDDAVLRDIDRIAQKGVSGAIGGFFKGIAVSGVYDILDKVCTIKGVLRASQLAARVYRARAMMQYASIFISASDQTRLGKTSSAAMAEVMKRVMTKDEAGKSFGSSPGIKRILGSKYSKTSNDVSKGNYGVDASLNSGFAGGLNDTLNRIPGTSEEACGRIQNVAVGITASVAEIGISFIPGAGQGFKATTKAFSTAMKASLKNMVTKKGMAKIAAGLAFEMSFEGAMLLLKIQAQRALQLNFTGQERGEELASAITGGMGTLNKQRAAVSGMVPATPEQYTAALNDYEASRNEEIRKQSFFARLFDYSNQDSLAFNMASMATTSSFFSLEPMPMLASISSSVIHSPVALMNSFANLTMPKTYAEDSDLIEFDEFDANGTKLATDHAGNVQMIMRDDIANIDPEENIEYLIKNGHITPDEPYDPASDDFINHREFCVDNIDILGQIEDGDKYDCMAKNQITKRFKAHLAYLDMTDGIDAWLFPEELTTSSSSNDDGSAASVNIPIDGLVWPLIQSKSQASSKCNNSTTQSVCHGGHNYLSHDLFAPQGTSVVSVSNGVVISAKVGTCGHGKGRAFTVSVFDEQLGVTYFYQHLDPNVTTVSQGSIVKPGDKLGEVGSSVAACDTPPHLHIDASKGRGRKACSRLSCSADAKASFIDISKALYKGYEALN